MYPALVVKDAIADRFRSKYKERPNIDRERPDVIVDVYIFDNRCIISLNSSGMPLYKRGYRGLMTFPAPLNEVLAAGMVALSEWDVREDFFNPMCGSGTLIVEAAMKAYNIQAGYLRDEFAFMNWSTFDKEEFEKLRRDPEGAVKKSKARLMGSDISRRALSITSHSLNLYHLGDKVELKRQDFMKATTGEGKGVLILNPPYGERLEVEDIEMFYKTMGDNLMNHYSNYRPWILSANEEALQYVNLKSVEKYELMNGDLPCKYICYDLKAGHKVIEA
ncbi:MAG: THUMP domain-containing protein [Vicingaceae bacterium]